LYICSLIAELSKLAIVYQPTHMSNQVKKRSPWLKRLLIGGFVLLLIGAGIYWYVATDKFADTSNRKAAYTVNAIDFIREFETNDSAANKKYREKIITVNGTISELESPDTASVNVKFIDTTSGAYAIFAFQEQHLAEAKALKVGDVVSIKGSCSGVAFSDILEVRYITFKRSALNKQ
jgi:hypothetical protein